jgi:hypothetical protein
MISYPLNIPNPDNTKIIEVQSLTNNIFDWTQLILSAKEIHSIDTAFVHVIESMFYQLNHPPIYYHRVRKTFGEFTRRLPWRTVEY